MRAERDPMLVRLRPLPKLLRIAHLAALIRCEGENSPRGIELARLLRAESTAIANKGGSAG
jgi:hypothetical protein